MALKSTSSPLAISDSIQITATGTGTTDFITEQIDLQLNPLDNEVFVVTGVKIDFRDLPKPDLAVAVSECHFEVAVCKSRPSSSQDISSSNVVAASRINTYSFGDPTAVPPTRQVYQALENNAIDTPPAGQEYLDIIATDNMFLSFLAFGELAAGQITSAAVRVYGYRAKADAATYAALVQSEVLSAN